MQQTKKSNIKNLPDNLDLFSRTFRLITFKCYNWPLKYRKLWQVNKFG